MKIVESERYVYREGRGFVLGTPTRHNADGPEILKWMRSIAKIESVGIKEIPRAIKTGWSSALGRFMDMETLKNGYGVMIYVVREHGLYRQWVYIDSPKFTNDGKCSRLSAMSEGAILKSIMKYKVGKRLFPGDCSVLTDYYDRYVIAAKNGTSSTDLLKAFLEYELDIQLPNKWSINDLRDAFEGALANGKVNTNDLYDNSEDEFHTKASYKTF